LVIECPHCRAKYHYSQERFAGKPARKVRCVKCQQVFEISNPGTSAPLSPEEALDETQTNRRAEPLEIAPIPEAESPPRKPPIRNPGRLSPEQQLQQMTGKQDARPKMPMGARLSLAVINGPDAGKVFRIDKPRVVIGRSDGDLTLNDAEASRAHAAIEIRDSIILLEDLGSTNGTFHKGKSIDEPQTLFNHSEFVIGSTTLMIIVTRDG